MSEKFDFWKLKLLLLPLTGKIDVYGKIKKLVKPLKITKLLKNGKKWFEEKTRQTAENKHTFSLTGKLKLLKKLVKSLKINKLTICGEKIEITEKTRQIAENKQTFE